MKNINMNRIHDIFGEDTEATCKFMHSIIESTEKLLNEIQVMIQKHELQASKGAFHRLQGSAANCGLIHLYPLALEAEAKLMTEDWSAVNEIYQCVLSEFNALKMEIKEEFKLDL